MRPQLPENALVILLRRCYTTPRCLLPLRPHARRPCPSRQCRRLPYSSFIAQRRGFQTHNGESSVRGPREDQFATPASQNPDSRSERKHIAILGGGITGLSTAHYISRELPTAKITIYEASERLGGWLQSKSVGVENGNIVFESGPRTLRPHTPAGLVTCEMIDHLKLQDDLIITSKESVAAQNRFVYYPDRLVKMPGPGQDIFAMMWTILTEPVFQGWPSAFLEFTRPQRATWTQYNNPDIDDESVGSFLERRFGGADIGNNVVSAVLHGIYAGDINQLSARSLLTKMWYDEAVVGSASKAAYRGLVQQRVTVPYNEIMLQQELQQKLPQSIKNLMDGASVYTFKQGIGALSNALEKSLRGNHNVSFETGSAVKQVTDDADGQSISVTTIKNQPPEKYTNVISTLYGKTLSNIAIVPTLAKMHAVTVMVVNLYFTDPHILPERGFGYLLPRSIPFEQNPECALGVVFDSDATAGQDAVPGTKVTVMLGGHWWDGLDAYPDEEEGAAMAQSILLRHLNISQQAAQVNVSLQRECIPQYTVGHESRMKKAHKELMDGYQGRLTVVGNSYTGVGLNDCVRAARDVAMKMKRGDDITGLEDFTVPKQWAQTRFVRTVPPSSEKSQD